MVKGTDWHGSSVFRSGWKGSEGFVKTDAISYSGRYLVPDPAVFKERVKRRAKQMIGSLLEAEADTGDSEICEILTQAVKKGLSVFASRRKE